MSKEAEEFLKANQWTETDLGGHLSNIAICMQEYAEQYHQQEMEKKVVVEIDDVRACCALPDIEKTEFIYSGKHKQNMGGVAVRCLNCGSFEIIR